MDTTNRKVAGDFTMRLTRLAHEFLQLVRDDKPRQATRKLATIQRHVERANRGGNY